MKLNKPIRSVVEQYDSFNVYDVIRKFFAAVGCPVDELLLKTIAESIDKGYADMTLVDDLEEKVCEAVGDYESKYGSYEWFSLPEIFGSICSKMSEEMIRGRKIDLQSLFIDSCWMDILAGFNSIQSSVVGDERRRILFTASCVFMHQFGQLYKKKCTILREYDTVLDTPCIPIGDNIKEGPVIAHIRHALTHNRISIQEDIVEFINEIGETKIEMQIDDFINKSLLVAESVKERDDVSVPEWIKKLATDLCCIGEGEIKRPCSWEMFISSLELFYGSVIDEFETKIEVFSTVIVNEVFPEFSVKNGK